VEAGDRMSVLHYGEARRLLNDAAESMDHPFSHEGGTKPADGRWRVVNFDGGHVGGRFDGVYLIARGDDHESSVLALCHHLGLRAPHPKDGVIAVAPDVGVEVVEVEADFFWLCCLPKGYTLPKA
jgi:hypothetical protein